MNNPNFIAEINKMKISNEAMFQLIRKTQNDVAIMRKRVDSFIDETNELCSIKDIVSRINKLENKLIMLMSQRDAGNMKHDIGLTIS